MWAGGSLRALETGGRWHSTPAERSMGCGRARVSSSEHAAPVHRVRQSRMSPVLYRPRMPATGA